MKSITYLLRRIYLLSFILVSMVVSANADSQAYVVFNPDDSTLTFCYDERYDARYYRWDIIPKNRYLSDLERDKTWHKYRTAIKKVVFDDSFSSYRPTYCCNWFVGMEHLTEIENINNLNTSEVTDMSYMFWRCSALKTIDVRGFDTQNVKDMSAMFDDCNALETLDVSGFDTQNVKDMSSMFLRCYALETLDVSGFDTQNVTDMSGMFESCSKLKNIDLSSFVTDKVTDMSYMFSRCSSLENIDVKNFNTENVSNMEGMFQGCETITSLDVSNFDTKNVTNINYMFASCKKIESLDLRNFNTEKVTEMQGVFSTIESLSSLYIGNFDTKNVTNMKYMFYDCLGLSVLDLSNFDTQNVKDMSWMFWGCSNLTTIFCNDTWTTRVSSKMFENCVKLVGAIKYDETVKGDYQNNTYSNPETGYFTYTNNAETYDLKVADQPVTQLNCQTLSVINGVTGMVRYDNTKKTLYLKDASILSTKESGFGIRSELDTLTVNVEGDCSIESEQWTAMCTGSIVVTGTGKLSLKGVRGMDFLSYIGDGFVESSMEVNGSVTINIDASKIGIDGANVLAGGTTIYLTTLNIASPDAILRVKGTDADLYQIKKMIFCEGQYVALPSGAFFSPQDLTIISDNGVVKNTWLEISTKKYVDRIDILGYTWPRDFEAADYEVSTTTPGCEITQVRYEMFRKVLDYSIPSKVHARDNVGVAFTVELKDGYEFSDKPVAYIDSCGTLLPCEFRLAGLTDKEKQFVWTYIVPTPEGGVYVRTVSETVDAPVTGALPQWTSENSATAGAKLVGGLPETTAKELSNHHTVQNIEWVEITASGTRQMGRDETFQAGKHYAVWFTVVPEEGYQFHERTEYTISAPVSETAVEIEEEDYKKAGAVVIKQGSKQSLMGYVFSLPYVLGDANSDGVVTMADANAVVNYFLATDKSGITNFNTEAANVNGDEDITMADANAIVNIFLGGQ